MKEEKKREEKGRKRERRRGERNTATQVACGSAGAIFEAIPSFGRDSEVEDLKKTKK